jgi:DNA repair exonuclease SbcCD nuclease subunit
MEGIKVLFFTDVHYKVVNRKETAILHETILKVMGETSPDIVVCGGDSLDTFERLHSDNLTRISMLFDAIRSKVPLYVLVGNHDSSIGNGIYLSNNHWLNCLKGKDNMRIVEVVETVTIGNIDMVMVPYVPPGRFLEALDTIDSWAEAHVIFAHQEFLGARMGAIMSEEGDVWSSEYPLVISGHVHVEQELYDGKVHYTGSSLQHAFGDSSDISFRVYNFGESVTHTKHQVPVPQKRIVRGKIDSIRDFVPVSKDDVVKISVDATHEEFKVFKKTNEYKALIDSGVTVSCKPAYKPEYPAYETERTSADEASEFYGILSSLVEGDPRVKRAYTELLAM